MGLFSSSAPVQLQPANPPVAVLPNYIQQHPVTLVLKEKAFTFSGDDFSVKDTNGQVVVRCEGRAFSMRDRKTISDFNHQPLFGLENKLFSFHKTFIAADPSGREIFRIKKHVSFGTKMSAQFTNVITGQPTELSVKGDMFGMDATIFLNESVPIAQISRQYMNAREIFTDNQTYFVTVAPGVDLALMAAVCICFDEAKNEKN